MTPREPDRFDKAALEIWGGDFTPAGFAAALRAAEASALERALAEVPSNQPDTRDRIRALIPPAAAPAAETGKAQGAEARIAEMEKALTDLINLIGAGVLVRDISRDGQPGWTLESMRLVMALKHAYAAVPALAARAAQSEETTCKGLPHVKRHKCMRCGGEFECTSFGCTAGDDVLPRRLIGGVVVEHDCTPTRKGTEWRVPTGEPTT